MNAAVENGLKPADGLHVACAMAMGCDYFFTVDKGILNKADKFPEVIIQNPVDFVLEKEGELC
jgi:predicted nucleic acid-binding protein